MILTCKINAFVHVFNTEVSSQDDGILVNLGHRTEGAVHVHSFLLP